jgi:hypothetical protein
LFYQSPGCLLSLGIVEIEFLLVQKRREPNLLIDLIFGDYLIPHRDGYAVDDLSRKKAESRKQKAESGAARP